jgi:alpha-D-ribose 1-methylphosphonate 5-phosphate C-P lyase
MSTTESESRDIGAVASNEDIQKAIDRAAGDASVQPTVREVLDVSAEIQKNIRQSWDALCEEFRTQDSWILHRDDDLIVFDPRDDEVQKCLPIERFYDGYTTQNMTDTINALHFIIARQHDLSRKPLSPVIAVSSTDD